LLGGGLRQPVLWQNAVVLQRLTQRKEWIFFGALPKADPWLASAWWAVLLLRGILPAAFAIAMGVLVGAVQRNNSLVGPLAFAGTIFVLLQVLSPATAPPHGCTTGSPKLACVRPEWDTWKILSSPTTSPWRAILILE
jgi:hypothetical protein